MAEQLAAAAADTPVQPALSGSIGVVTRTEGSGAAEEPLFTWVIAPASQA